MGEGPPGSTGGRGASHLDLNAPPNQTRTQRVPVLGVIHSVSVDIDDSVGERLRRFLRKIAVMILVTLWRRRTARALADRVFSGRSGERHRSRPSHSNVDGYNEIRYICSL
jgi:hypothetical protein